MPTHPRKEAILAARTLLEELNDPKSENRQDIDFCGAPTSYHFRRALLYILDDLDEQTSGPSVRAEPDDLKATIDTVFDFANENINATPFNLVSRCWLRLYTDSSLIRSLIDVTYGPSVTQCGESFWSSTIKRLDMAIIVAGAVGDGRLEMVHGVITLVQRIGLPRRSRVSSAYKESGKTSKRKYPEKGALLYAQLPIVELQSPPSLSSYLRNHREGPFILRGYVRENNSSSPCPAWAAIKKWKSGDYILDLVGEGRVVPVEVGRAYDECDWGQKIVPLRDFLRRSGYLVEGETDAAEYGPPWYLAQTSLLKQFPQLAGDISYPDYIWSSPPSPSYMPTYRPPQNDEGLVVNFWIGSGREEVVSPAHTDPYYNCYCQVLGRKRVWLAPPQASPYMSPHNIDVSSQVAGLAAEYMSNTSTVPILRHDEGFMNLKDSYPLFFEHVAPVSSEAVLEAGDMLVMPPGWWHAMRGESEGTGWSVSMWY